MMIMNGEKIEIARVERLSRLVWEDRCATPRLCIVAAHCVARRFRVKFQSKMSI